MELEGKLRTLNTTILVVRQKIRDSLSKESAGMLL